MMTTDWNLADIWELCAQVRVDQPALRQGGLRRGWDEFGARADALASYLLAAGLARQDKVAQYLYNSFEYLESVFACFKASLVPVNTNYRYGDAELSYLWDNADAAVVVFHGAFADRVARLRPSLPKVRLFLHVDDGSGPCPGFAVPYEEAVAGAPRPENLWPGATGPGVTGRSGDDLLLLYTGGTTGMPKGVMWRQDDLFSLLNAGSILKLPEDRGLDGIREALGEIATPPVLLPACPLMHGTGSFTSFTALSVGGSVAMLKSRHFDPVELLDTVESEKVNVVTIVGDAFAKPILAALEADPGRWDLTSLVAMISSGVMWSEETKRGLLAHQPAMMLVDAFSSSEALGMGASVSASGAEAHTARFRLGDNARVIDENGAVIPPGTGQEGRLALSGRMPVGYYKDEEKTRSTFVLIDGVRYSVPGDYATVEADGTLHLLGRGSVCINTGGEKVYPEEVEEVLKTHPAVADAACVGVPDSRFGETIAAVVSLKAAGTRDEPELAAELAAHVRAELAAYKVPRHVVVVESLGRSPSGKLDYAALRSLALERSAALSSGSPRDAGRGR